METLTRFVSESLARHGFDRPLDYRRLHWSRWFRCESHHSLLLVPSKPGVFALAEEIVNLGSDAATTDLGCLAERSSAMPNPVPMWGEPPKPALSEVEGAIRPSEARRDLPADTTAPTCRRMLAVTQFFDDDDMAFILDRMLSHQNPMHARLASGRYFIRFVVIEDQAQRRSICSALNQWIVSAAEKATGIGAHFATSLELTPATEYVPPDNDAQAKLFENRDHVARTRPERQSKEPSPANADRITSPEFVAEAATSATSTTAPHLDSGAATNSPFPSGF